MADKDKSILKKSWEFVIKGKDDSESDDDQGLSTMNLKHTPINQKQNMAMIDYLTSEHIMCLQYSKYIKFENDVQRVIEHKERSRMAQNNKDNMGISSEQKKFRMFLRYCKEDEVMKKNHVFLVFKGAFLAKLKQIDSNG